MNRFRIEERDADTGAVLIATEQGWDGPLTEAEAQGRFARELREHPGRYAIGSPYRLVLVVTNAPTLDLHDVASDQAIADLRDRLNQPVQPSKPNPYDPRKPRLHSVRKTTPDLGDVASGRVPLPPTGGASR